MRDRTVSHIDLELLGDDPEGLAGVREFGRFRVLPPYRRASWALPVLIGGVIFGLSLSLPLPWVLLGFALGFLAIAGLMAVMKWDDRKSPMRDARAYLDRHIVPCLFCGTDRTWGGPERACRGCGAALNFDSLLAFWEMRTTTTGMNPKKDDPDVIKPLFRLRRLGWPMALAPSLLPVVLALMLTLGVSRRWSALGALLYLTLCISGALVPLVLEVRLHRSVRRKAGGLDILFCPECMHDLRGLPSEGVCPECGRIYSAPRVRAKWWLFDLRWILKHGRRVPGG